jgi:hypothetical protein
LRDEFTEEVKRVIAHRANLVCSNPDCRASTAGPQDDPSKALNIGVAAHITAASSGGPRHDSTITAELRKSAENGIWLCQNCAKLVDNDESLYPSRLLVAWKTVREHSALLQIGQNVRPQALSESERKARELSSWKGKEVMLVKMSSPQHVLTLGVRPWAPIRVALIECTEFSVHAKGNGWDRGRSIPMRNIEIGYDDRFKIIELMEYDR